MILRSLMYLNKYFAVLISFAFPLQNQGEDVVLVLLKRTCTSRYVVYWNGSLLVINGLLLVFGAFLAWETRKVTVPALNDSKYIGGYTLLRHWEKQTRTIWQTHLFRTHMPVLLYKNLHEFMKHTCILTQRQQSNSNMLRTHTCTLMSTQAKIKTQVHSLTTFYYYCDNRIFVL